MTKDEMRALINAKIAGQGNQVDSGGALAEILTELVDNAGGGGGDAEPVSITYSELKSLRDAGTLEVGTRYRITDYVATTIQEETRSANHPFDIIVKAIATNALDEKASAALHDGDTYFANCDLSKWQLWYNLDNDSTKYAWADADNGKGVVFRMIDEFNNDCPFDFKGLQFKRYAIASIADFAQNFSGMCVVPAGSTFNNALNLVVSDSFAWFYTFSTAEGTIFPDVDYLDATVLINDAAKEYDFVNGRIFDNCLVPYLDDGDIGMIQYLNNDVFFVDYYLDTDTDEDDNEVTYFEYNNPLNNMKLLGGSCKNTFFNGAVGSSFAGAVIGNIWHYCKSSTSLGSTISQNILYGQVISLGSTDVSIASNFLFFFGGNTFYGEIMNVIAKKAFQWNIVQNMTNVTFECGFIRGNIGNEVAYATITASNASKNVEHAYILNGTRGTAAVPITITFPYQEVRFAQFAAKNSTDAVKVWVPADAVQ